MKTDTREKMDLNLGNNSQGLKIVLSLPSISNKPNQRSLIHVKLPNKLNKYLENIEMSILILISASKAKT